MSVWDGAFLPCQLMANQRATVRPRSRRLHICLGISLFSSGDCPGRPKPPLARPRATVGTTVTAPCCQLPHRTWMDGRPRLLPAPQPGPGGPGEQRPAAAAHHQSPGEPTAPCAEAP